MQLLFKHDVEVYIETIVGKLPGIPDRLSINAFNGSLVYQYFPIFLLYFHFHVIAQVLIIQYSAFC